MRAPGQSFIADANPGEVPLQKYKKDEKSYIYNSIGIRYNKL